ncbi:MAG: sigma-70 family RNA polymerase sigma factor [Saprospiraceae bacterium]
MCEAFGGLRQPLTDIELAKACSLRDWNAQAMLFDKFKVKMFALCLRFARSYEEGEDILQEGFVHVFNDINQFKGIGSLEGWIRKIVLRTALSYIKKRTNELQIVELADLENKLIYEMEQIEVDFDDPKSLISLLQKMPDGFRAVMNLYVLEEKSHEEIASLLGISESTSRSQLSRGKEFLRKLVHKRLMII